MKPISIKATERLAAIKEAFRDQYPYLKLEFFHHSHEPEGGNPKSDMIKRDMTVEEARREGKGEDGYLRPRPGMTVEELEMDFRDRFGLNVQVFRLSGRIWLQTTLTDHWTLEKQNAEGEEHTNIASA